MKNKKLPPTNDLTPCGVYARTPSRRPLYVSSWQNDEQLGLTVCKKKYNMKKIIILLIVVLATMTSFAQTQTNVVSSTSPDNDIVYRLFPTQNIYNFILLDQLDGRVWQVQWSIEAKTRMVIPIE